MGNLTLEKLLEIRNDAMNYGLPVKKIIVTKKVIDNLCIETPEGIYLLIHPVTLLRIEQELNVQTIMSSSVFGIPVVEDDKQANDLLLFALKKKLGVDC